MGIIIDSQKNRIISDLKELLYKIKTANENEINSYGSKVKSYIYSEDILIKVYKDRLHEFESYQQTDEFITNINIFYDDIYSTCQDWRKNWIVKEKPESFLYQESMQFLFDPIQDKSKRIEYDYNVMEGIFCFYLLITQRAKEYLNENVPIESNDNIQLLRNKIAHCCDFYFFEIWTNVADLDDTYNIVKLMLKVSILQILKELIFVMQREEDIIYEQDTKQAIKCPLTEEEIKILKLRNDLDPNTYENIGKNLSPQLTPTNVTQKFRHIKDMLGATSPDRAVSIAKEKYPEKFA